MFKVPVNPVRSLTHKYPIDHSKVIKMLKNYTKIPTISKDQYEFRKPM